MGDCYFLSNYTQHRGEPAPDRRIDLVIRSEDLGQIITSGYMDRLSKDRRKLQLMINGSYGIFFYESNLWDKKHLKEQLHKLIDEALEKYSAEPL